MPKGTWWITITLYLPSKIRCMLGSYLTLIRILTSFIVTMNAVSCRRKHAWHWIIVCVSVRRSIYPVFHRQRSNMSINSGKVSMRHFEYCFPIIWSRFRMNEMWWFVDKDNVSPLKGRSRISDEYRSFVNDTVGMRRPSNASIMSGIYHSGCTFYVYLT